MHNFNVYLTYLYLVVVFYLHDSNFSWNTWRYTDASAVKDNHNTSCTLCIVHTVHRAHCASCTLFIVHTVHRAHCSSCTLCIVHTVHRAHCASCTVFIVHTVHRAHCASCTLFIVHTVHPTENHCSSGGKQTTLRTIIDV